ncbi:MAG: hypothetical protein JWM48_1169 [Mycobacterium sp.]|jgi:hypothetical protein|nr:hypothetical protein [Mycobacterium sp.]MCW2744619.1 hypothetical protein [Mycobacterium sp.]
MDEDDQLGGARTADLSAWVGQMAEPYAYVDAVGKPLALENEVAERLMRRRAMPEGPHLRAAVITTMRRRAYRDAADAEPGLRTEELAALWERFADAFLASSVPPRDTVLLDRVAGIVPAAFGRRRTPRRLAAARVLADWHRVGQAAARLVAAG